MKFYVMKLLGPRSTFPFDITADERTLMQAHSQYWRAEMAKGSVVVFGPVMDSTGPYGIGILRLDDGVDPMTLANLDPVITANLGFRYHMAPMAAAVVAT